MIRQRKGQREKIENENKKDKKKKVGARKKCRKRGKDEVLVR